MAQPYHGGLIDVGSVPVVLHVDVSKYKSHYSGILATDLISQALRFMAVLVRRGISYRLPFNLPVL